MFKNLIRMYEMDLRILILTLFIFNSAYSVGSESYVDFRSAFDNELYESVINEEQCTQQITFMLNNSLGLQFLDASAKFPPGLFGGNVNDLGDYFQCLGINEMIDNMEIQGKYCAIIVPLEQEPIQIPEFPEWPDIPWPEIPLPELPWPEIPWPQPDNETIALVETSSKLRRFAMELAGQSQPELRIFPMVTTLTSGLTLGICIPKVCSSRQAIDFFISQTPFLNLTYGEYFCRLPNDKIVSGADYAAIVIFSLIGVIIVISTAYDLYLTFVLKRDLSSINVLYSSFSVYTNTRRFLTFKSFPGALECVDGIRAISMMWVIVGHTYSMTLLTYIHNLRYTIDNLAAFKMTWVNAAPITVDTFFMLSGILAVYTTVGKISRLRFIKTIHLFYLNRLLRMFPLLATAILLQITLFHRASDGPFWVNVAHAVENCKTYWWSALLHVQNYVNSVNICLSQTWYLSVDIQLYLVCPILMVFLFGRQPIAWGALSVFVLLSLAASTTYSFVYNFSAALANTSRLAEFNSYVRNYYLNTLPRAPPFFVGMVYGYLLHLYRDKKLRMTRLNVTVLWVICFVLLSFCVFSMYPVMQPDHTGQMFDNFLNSYMRAIWACALGWLIFACVQGYGGPINWFLSLRVWKLPARLSYAMYLIHLPIIFTANGSWVKTHYFSNGEALYRFMGDISLSIVAAFILCICIDAPFSTIQKLLMNAGKKPQKPRPKVVHEVSSVDKTNL